MSQTTQDGGLRRKPGSPLRSADRGMCRSPSRAQHRTRCQPSAAPMLLLCQRWLVLEGCVDGAGELSFEAAECFAACLALGLFAFQVGACGWVPAALGNGDAVEGAVELPVAAAVEAMPLALA